ncbi:MAG: hypothetical protein RXR59_08595 [Sulfolobus sp.]
MIKVLTEKKESVEDFMEKYSSLGREVLERIFGKGKRTTEVINLLYNPNTPRSNVKNLSTKSYSFCLCKKD